MRILFGVLAMVATASCATPYRAGSMDGFLCGGGAGELFCGGVNASPLGGDAYRIEASLNRYSSQSRLQDYLLLRAAELALQNGAIGFVIQDTQNTSREGLVITRGNSSTTGFVHGSGDTAMVSATTTYQPWQATNFVRPGGLMVIALVRAPVQRGVRYFDASEIIAAIGPRVRSDDGAASPAQSTVAANARSTEAISTQAQSSEATRMPQPVAVSQAAFAAVRCDDVEADWDRARQQGDWAAARMEENRWRSECSIRSR